MTTPHERFRALIRASDFIYRLTNPELSKRVPKVVRDEARSILRHFPFPIELEELAKLDRDGILIEDGLAPKK